MARPYAGPVAGLELARTQIGADRDLVLRVNGEDVDLRQWSRDTEGKPGLPLDEGVTVPRSALAALYAELTAAVKGVT